MRYAVPLGAILLMGFAFWVRPVLAGPTASERRLPERRETPSTTREPEMFRGVSVPARIESSLDSKGKLQESVAALRKGDSYSWRKLAVPLVQNLSLSPLQQESVEQVLRDRSEEIRICHEEIRRAQLLDVRQYEWQVGRMKEAWFRRIDRNLDSPQHQRFVELVEQGLFNEGLGFTEEPGMIVLD